MALNDRMFQVSIYLKKRILTEPPIYNMNIDQDTRIFNRENVNRWKIFDKDNRHVRAVL